MKEVRGRSRPHKAIPPTYQNTIQTGKWDLKENVYVLTPEQLQEVINKYGPPLMKMNKRKGQGSAFVPGKKVKG